MLRVSWHQSLPRRTFEKSPLLKHRATFGFQAPPAASPSPLHLPDDRTEARSTVGRPWSAQADALCAVKRITPAYFLVRPTAAIWATSRVMKIFGQNLSALATAPATSVQGRHSLSEPINCSWNVRHAESRCCRTCNVLDLQCLCPVSRVTTSSRRVYKRCAGRGRDHPNIAGNSAWAMRLSGGPGSRRPPLRPE